MKFGSLRRNEESLSSEKNNTIFPLTRFSAPFVSNNGKFYLWVIN